MGKIEVYKCDGCGKLIEKTTDVYQIKFESVGWIFEYDGYEHRKIDLHFCYSCAMNIKNTLNKILTKLSEDKNENK